MAEEWHWGDYTISTDKQRFDVDAFHAFIRETYWARGRRRRTTEEAVANSIIFGLYGLDGDMVGAARVVTDSATFGWLSDVYVLEAHRGRGLGKALVAAVCDHPQLRTVKRLLLATADAHTLYEQHGFRRVSQPDRLMERRSQG